MKKILLILGMTLLVSSCTDESVRQKNLQKIYPNCKVEPATGLIQENGYEFTVIDSTGQMIAVSFYAWSETKISRLRNVR